MIERISILCLFVNFLVDREDKISVDVDYKVTMLRKGVPTSVQSPVMQLKAKFEFVPYVRLKNGVVLVRTLYVFISGRAAQRYC